MFQNLDDMLKDIEEGGIERRLDNLANMLDNGTKQVVEVTDKVAKAPERALRTAEKTATKIEVKVRAVERTAETISGQTGDVVRRSMRRRQPEL